MITSSLLSRPVCVALLVLTGLTQPSMAQSESEGAPPPLQTVSSQFVEIRPLVLAPALKLQRIDGKTIDLRSLLGRVVLLSFWATWCPPCRRELPMLERLERMLGPRDVEVVAVAVGSENKLEIAAFLERVGVTQLRPFVDPRGKVGVRPGEESGSPFILYGMPITYVIDRQGRPAGYFVGEVDWTSQVGIAMLRYYAGVY